MLPQALAPLTRVSILALGWDRAPSLGSAEKGCQEKPGIDIPFAPSFTLVPSYRGKNLTPELRTFPEAQLVVDMLPWALVCRGWGSLGTPESPGWPCPGPYSVLALLVRDEALDGATKHRPCTEWLGEEGIPLPASAPAGTISWAFQKPRCVDCPISQKRCPGILVTRLAL